MSHNLAELARLESAVGTAAKRLLETRLCARAGAFGHDEVGARLLASSAALDKARYAYVSYFVDYLAGDRP